MSIRVPSRRAAAVAAAALVLFVSLAAVGAQAAPPEAKKANYDLASRWTPAKVGKLVFDTSVMPHWLSTGDRFWYSYETSQGRKWFIVDPAAKSKRPLFDNAKMAAQLTRILLIPYDAQHLPIKTIKFINKDSAVQFEIEVPKDNDILVNGKVVKASEIAKEEVDGPGRGQGEREGEGAGHPEEQGQGGREAQGAGEEDQGSWPSLTSWRRVSSPSSKTGESRSSGPNGPTSRPTRRPSSSPVGRTCS